MDISARQTDETICITVADTGIGISEDHLEHIFDEFRQADSSTSRRFGGTGLGLAIAKKYAILLGGEISVASSPGEGSEFTLILPSVYAGANGGSHNLPTSIPGVTYPKAGTVAHSNSGVKTILLVEDNEPAAIQMKDFLEESGYHLLLARNGSDALEIIASVIPDAMILDLMMPGMDGFEVLKTLREEERTAHIPVLILTAKHITREELSFLKRNNIHQLIQKGDVKRSELQAAVAAMVTHAAVEIPAAGNERIKGPVPADGNVKVLVVEDNPDNMLTVKAVINGKYTVLEARDGKEGVEMARQYVPDFILMDIELPEMDGIQAFKAIRSDVRLQHIPVIALTASAMTSDRETILAYGLDAYIVKPIDAKQFFKTIDSVLYGK